MLQELLTECERQASNDYRSKNEGKSHESLEKQRQEKRRQT